MFWLDFHLNPAGHPARMQSPTSLIDYAEIHINKAIRLRKLLSILDKQDWEAASTLLREDNDDNALLLQWLREQDPKSVQQARMTT